MFSREFTLQRRLAATLVVCLFYQLGACSCGCVEHNYWLRTLGLAEDHQHPDTSSDDLSLVANDHDCDGSQELPYIDNSVQDVLGKSLVVRSHYSSGSAFTLPKGPAIRLQDRGPPDRQHGQFRCAMSQVLLI